MLPGIERKLLQPSKQHQSNLPNERGFLPRIHGSGLKKPNNIDEASKHRKTKHRVKLQPEDLETELANSAHSSPRSGSIDTSGTKNDSSLSPTYPVNPFGYQNYFPYGGMQFVPVIPMPPDPRWSTANQTSYFPHHRNNIPHVHKHKRRSRRVKNKTRSKSPRKQSQNGYDSNVLHQQIRSAALIQKWWRKRSKQRKTALFWMDSAVRHTFLINSHCDVLMKSILNEFIQCEVLPEILIEIFSNKQFMHVNINLHPDELVQRQIAIETYESVELAVIKQDLCPKIVKEAMDDFIRSWLHKCTVKQHGVRFLSETTVTDRLCEEIISETLREILWNLVRVCIEELIVKFLIKRACDDEFDAQLEQLLASVCSAAVSEAILNDVVAGIIEEVLVLDLLPSGLGHVLDEEKLQMQINKKQEELVIIQNKLQSFLIDQTLLQVMMETLSTRDQKGSIDRQVELWLNTMLAKHMINTHLDVSRVLERTQGNAILKHLLTKMVCEHGMDKFINYIKSSKGDHVEEKTKDKRWNWID